MFDLKSALSGASRVISFCFWFLFLLVFVHPSDFCVPLPMKSFFGGAGWEGIDTSLFLNYFLMHFLKEMFVCIPGEQVHSFHPAM